MHTCMYIIHMDLICDKINDTSMVKGWIIKQLEILGELAIWHNIKKEPHLTHTHQIKLRRMNIKMKPLT